MPRQSRKISGKDSVHATQENPDEVRGMSMLRVASDRAKIDISRLNDGSEKGMLREVEEVLNPKMNHDD